MREKKIRYTFKHVATGNVEQKIYTLSQLEERTVKELSPCFNLGFGYELIGRDDFTGLKDKNGKEIFEGDIVRVNKLTYETSGLLPENLMVKYYGGMFQFFRGENDCLMGLHLLYLDDGEVIGNIYEHKHLLGVRA